MTVGAQHRSQSRIYMVNAFPDYPVGTKTMGIFASVAILGNELSPPIQIPGFPVICLQVST